MLLYTDGITEARDASRKMMGFEGLLRLLGQVEKSLVISIRLSGFHHIFDI